MHLKFFPREDYDMSVKIGQHIVSCYSKDRMKALYSNKGYLVVGEIGRKTAGQPIGKLMVGSYEVEISELQKKHGLMYKVSGYAMVDNEAYVAVIESRVPLLILTLIVIIGLAAYYIAASSFWATYFDEIEDVSYTQYDCVEKKDDI